MAIEEKNIASVAETIAKFGGSRSAKFGGSRCAKFEGKHGSDAEEKKAIQSVPDAAIEGSMKGKSLYLAFSQVMDDGRMYFVVKSIKLSDAIDGRRRTSSTDSYSINSISSKLLRRVGYTALIFGPCCVRCGLFHSSIVFAGMMSRFDKARDGDEEIWVFEADENLKPNLRIKPFSMPTFNHKKYCPLLVELQGKLYALGLKTTAKGGFMEVFDQTQNKWLSLPDPPTMITEPNKLVSMVVAGQKILLSIPDVSGVFCFEPEIQNWKAIHSLGAGLPFKGAATVFDDDACGGFLMFKFNYGVGKSNTISVFFMSHQFDSIQTLKSVELPCLPREFYRRFQFGLDRLGVGGRNFCLVLNRFFTKDKYEFDGVVSDEFPQHNNKGFFFS